MDTATAVLSFILGGSFLGFLQFLITRKDSKNDRFDAIVKELAEVRADIKSIIASADERAAVNCRVRILRFEDDLRDNRNPSAESFEQVLTDISNYEKYSEKHPDFPNSKAVMTIDHIKAVYKERYLNKQGG